MPDFGLLGKLHQGLSVLLEEHHLQDQQELGLVRAENFQVPFRLHHRRPEVDIKIVPLSSGPTFWLITCKACDSGITSRLHPSLPVQVSSLIVLKYTVHDSLSNVLITIHRCTDSGTHQARGICTHSCHALSSPFDEVWALHATGHPKWSWSSSLSWLQSQGTLLLQTQLVACGSALTSICCCIDSTVASHLRHGRVVILGAKAKQCRFASFTPPDLKTRSNWRTLPWVACRACHD